MAPTGSCAASSPQAWRSRAPDGRPAPIPRLLLLDRRNERLLRARLGSEVDLIAVTDGKGVAVCRGANSGRLQQKRIIRGRDGHVAIPLETGRRRDQLADDHVLLEPV